jgi:leucyl-tRNA synthetase
MSRVQHEYIPQEIESKWQQKWNEARLFDVDHKEGLPKKYVLEMFPYPSGRLHMGHVRNYAIGDVMARFFRMQGYNVLHPMGWDAFGLPAENAAIQNKVHPLKWTHENIANMKSQMSRLGVSYDWRREVTTCAPEYYKWEQLIFLKMLKEGQAYRAKRSLNWCPSCVTVLANEEVVDGVCWRCDSVVTQKEMDQWFFKTTKYAQELLDCLDKLPQWPDRVKQMQAYWIGRSEGAEIDFGVEAHVDKIKVFTTRPDTIYGVNSVILAPEHSLVSKIAKNKNEVESFIQKMKTLDKDARTSEDTEKEGVFTGSYAIHPLSKEKIPIWIANFVVTDYGTGALMAVPAHDVRDYAFAQKYNLPIKQVVEFSIEDQAKDKKFELPFCDDGVSINSPEINGLSTEAAHKKITEILEKQKNGKAKVNYRLRDWGISRQRYWGCPIPVIYCDKDGVVPVPESQLPVMLPDDVEFSGKGGSPLGHHEKFAKTKCPTCGGDAKRETDTMGTFVDSSWYYARFCAINYNDSAVSKVDGDKWLPIDHYIGGVEHATGHLLYFRFFHKLMRDWGWVKGDEPAMQLICQGMVYKDGAKMSKSKGNVVDPDDLIKKMGADTARLFMLFAGPIEKDLEWSDKGVEGCYRFLGRVYRLVLNGNEELQGVKAQDISDDATTQKIQHMLHKTIQNVTVDIQKDFHYNTAISFMMEFVNALYLVDLKAASPSMRSLFKLCLEKLVLMLAPFAPHMCDEMWSHLGYKTFTLNEKWPEFDKTKALVSEKEIVLQVNGKIRDRVQMSAGTPEAELQKLALANPKIIESLKGATPKKVIVVKDKLVNIVI